METAKSTRVNSLEMDGQNETSEIQSFMQKYEALDKDRKKYMICFFVLFGLVLTFLVIILVGLTAVNNKEESNINTCHADTGNQCTNTDNDFVTLTDSDTDTPVATYNGWLEVFIQNRNLTNYSRTLTINGTVIYDLDGYIWDLQEYLLETEGGYDDVEITIKEQQFYGEVDYEYLVKSCNILYTGHSSFTLRMSYDDQNSTRKYISSLQITSEQCDNEISNGLPTTDTFEIKDDTFYVECLYGDNDLCQVYLQETETININDFNVTMNPINNHTHRRLSSDYCKEKGNIILERENRKCTVMDKHNRDRIETIYTYWIYENDKGRKWWGNVDIYSKNGDAPLWIKTRGYECYYRCSKWKCFPSESIVNTPYGDKNISDLNIGDQVLTVNSYTGELEYSDIYMYGHKIKDVMAEFTTLYTTNVNFQISASADHFIYVCDGQEECQFEQGALLKRFKDVNENEDYIFDKEMNKYLVIKKEIKEMSGLYNPYTLNGNIIVNGIIASCHSEWILDDLIADKYDSYLPSIYQTIFTPVRFIYAYIPNKWLLFNTLYPYGLNDISNVNFFDFIKQVFWSLSSDQSS